jgi:hypothetical protein
MNEYAPHSLIDSTSDMLQQCCLIHTSCNVLVLLFHKDVHEIFVNEYLSFHCKLCNKCKGKRPKVSLPYDWDMWVGDTGASLHVTNDMANFVNYREMKDPIVFKSAAKGIVIAAIHQQITGLSTGHYIVLCGSYIAIANCGKVPFTWNSVALTNVYVACCSAHQNLCRAIE